MGSYYSGCQGPLDTSGQGDISYTLDENLSEMLRQWAHHNDDLDEEMHQDMDAT